MDQDCWCLKAGLGGLVLDMFKAVEFTLIDARAVGFELLPGFRSSEMFSPEGPGFALDGSDRIDGACSMLRVEINAIAVGVFFE